MARAQFSAETSGGGAFVRQPNRFTGRVTADSTSPPGGGPDEQDRWPLEAGRYRLVWCRACPWAHRARIVRGLLGLDDAISLGTVDPIRDERGWAFALDPDGFDPVLGVSFLSEAYLATDPDYTGRVTVPALVDTVTGRVVTNDYPQLTLDFSTQWRSLHRAGAPDLYPEALRPEMDALMAEIHIDVNNGVYRCGFATSQQAYDEAFRALFARLDALSERLSGQRYLMGDAITEADVRLFTTLVRFDAAYHGHFRCNRDKLTEMPVLWAYARDLFQTPGFGETVDFDHIKRHYYGTHREINPSGIVPLGPDESGWSTPHGRG
ncbi:MULTISPECIES: glutathione S-transferase family protein [Micromonospora]|uniref:glutathione S-transferase family protein n=1 Tax=Micromonospora TaxID=1873 RepID=UPI001EE97045|nr:MULTISPECIES: glutathione S-transferase C-terminal domain-containing protein [Micromonospora]MCG5452580.1 glutathione S-transferase C-terminal domain-containing protein [Micromonospora hortensis]MCX5118212.1 glutathione S-transferase C-terminal domain-containing protein [Micromonospora sp. NBC_00362]WTI09610.1 glutathione S-transferase C-terminal domain-containing protein [Micromonospora sp. NBC_00821]